MKKIAIFKVKNKNETIKVIENKTNTFVKLGKKIMKFPLDFENTIIYLRKIEII